MLPLPLLLTALRLTCWPFEVEGAGEGTGDPAAGASSAARAAPPAAAAVPTPDAPVVPPLPESLPRAEAVRYDIRYGVLGSIGTLSIATGDVAYAEAGAPIITVRAAGRGSVLGLGGMEHRIEVEFDVRSLGSRRWREARGKEGGRAEDETVDVGERNGRGENRVNRRAPGKPEETQTFSSATPTSDLLGMIWRLRTAPPPLGRTETVLVLDGLALWRVQATTVALADPVPDTALRALRVEGALAPIDYGGGDDPRRKSRRFTMWLDPRTSHVPLRLEVPVGPADVVLALVEARRLLAEGSVPSNAAGRTAPMPGDVREPSPSSSSD